MNLDLIYGNNKELKDYVKVFLKDNDVSFLEKYLELDEMVRLKSVGQFCGCDYNKLFDIRFYYSVFDHSLVTALITYNFTRDKAATIAALFHDLGTPNFNHCVDIMLGDSMTQESSEKTVFEIIKNNIKIKEYLLMDGIALADVVDYKQYSIADNKAPKLCADRLEGVLHTNYIWLSLCELNVIEEIYNSIIVVNNNGVEELGFSWLEDGEVFFNLVYNYAMVLQQNEDLFTMTYIANALKVLIKKNIISFDNLYNMKEKEIVSLFEKYIDSWDDFKDTEAISRYAFNNGDNIYERVPVKKRYVDPICLETDDLFRLSEGSYKVKRKIQQYLNYEDCKFYGN